MTQPRRSQQPATEPLRLPLGIRPSHRNDDYVNLFPHGIFPTGDIDVLEIGNNLLVIKSYEWSKMAKMPKPHRRIFNLLARFGSPPDAPGSISVVCVEGLGLTERRWILFDHQGEHPTRYGTVDDWRVYLLSWYRLNRKHR